MIAKRKKKLKYCQSDFYIAFLKYCLWVHKLSCSFKSNVNVTECSEHCTDKHCEQDTGECKGCMKGIYGVKCTKSKYYRKFAHYKSQD